MDGESAVVSDTTAAATTVPTTTTTTTTATGPLLSIDILTLIKDAQGQHGLRHSDYQRYRQYCSRKISRLRKSLDFVNAKGKRFMLRPVTAEVVTDVRHLHILLFEAERAWGYAMQLKREISMEPRKKYHMVRRLHKAVHYARDLEAICNRPICTARSALEAQAYHSFLEGIALFETQQWQKALDLFVRSRAIYVKLAEAGTPQQEALCNARVEEIDPSIRYCAYNLGQLKGGSERELTELIALQTQGENASLVMLSDKLDSLLLGNQKQTDGLTEITWRGKTLPLRNERLRELLLKAQQMETEIATQSNAGRANDGLLALFDKLLALYSDALATAQQDVKVDEEATAKAKSQKSSENTAILRSVLAYVTSLRLLQTFERNLVLVANTVNRLPSSDGVASDSKPSEKPSRIEDVIHLYDVILQNWTELRAQESVDNDPAFASRADANILLFRAHRCHYGGRLLETASRWAEALAIYERSEELIGDINKTKAVLSDKERQMIQQLQQQTRIRKSFTKASAVFDKKPDTTSSNLPKTPLIDRLDNALSPEDVDPQRLNLVAFPPRFEAAPAKPVFFDLAENYLELPSFTSRASNRDVAAAVGAAATGITTFISNLWGGGAAPKK